VFVNGFGTLIRDPVVDCIDETFVMDGHVTLAVVAQLESCPCIGPISDGKIAVLGIPVVDIESVQSRSSESCVIQRM
jgi:hypothetical protein